jgi:adenosylhomocysteine nucleosidase
MGHVASPMRIIAVTGLKREAAIVASPEAIALSGGGDSARLRRELDALAGEARGLISIGIAGALDPALKVGDAVIGSAVMAGARRHAADPRWTARLQAALPSARLGIGAGVDHILGDAAAKAVLRKSSAADFVDMESHVVAEAAAAHGLPFAVLRFVSDTAGRALPRAALVGMRADGGMDLGAVLRSIAGDPGQVPALVRTGMEAETAFRALVRGRLALGDSLGFADI